MDADEASTIGARARKIRRRRGLSLDVVAGLASAGSIGAVCWRTWPPPLAAR